MVRNDESALDALFQRYRAACPDAEPSAQFMPALWQKIEARHGFWAVFQNLAQRAMAGCAALTLMLVALNLMSLYNTQHDPSYTDALVAEHSAEKTAYTENVVVATAMNPERVDR